MAANQPLNEEDIKTLTDKLSSSNESDELIQTLETMSIPREITSFDKFSTYQKQIFAALKKRQALELSIPPDAEASYKAFLEKTKQQWQAQYATAKATADKISVDKFSEAVATLTSAEKIGETVNVKFGDLRSDFLYLQQLRIQAVRKAEEDAAKKAPQAAKPVIQSAAETKDKAEDTATGILESVQALGSGLVSRASDAEKHLTGLAKNVIPGVAAITRDFDAIKQQGTELVQSRLGRAAETAQNAVMDVVAKNLPTIPDLQRYLTEQFNQKFPELGIVTQLINPNDPKAGLALLTNVAGAAGAVATQAVKFCTVKSSASGAYEFIFERNSAIKDPATWESMIEKTIRAAAEARAPGDQSPIPYKNGTKEEIIKFHEVAKRMNIPLDFDPASKAIVDEFEKNAKPDPDAPSLGGKNKSKRA